MKECELWDMIRDYHAGNLNSKEEEELEELAKHDEEVAFDIEWIRSLYYYFLKKRIIEYMENINQCISNARNFNSTNKSWTLTEGTKELLGSGFNYSQSQPRRMMKDNYLFLNSQLLKFFVFEK